MPVDPQVRQSGTAAYLGMSVAETTYGTAVARTKFYPIISETLKYGRERLPSNRIAANAVPSSPGFSGGKWGGSVVVEQQYEGVERLLKHLMGTVSEGNTSGTVYYHTFTPALVMPVGLTVEVPRGSSNNAAFVYEGGKVTGANFKISNSEVPQWTFNMIGEDVAQGNRTSPTFPSYLPVIPAHYRAGTGLGTGYIKFGTTSNVTANLLECSLDFSRPFQEDKFVVDTGLLSEPMPSGPMTIKGTIKGDFGQLGAGSELWSTIFKTGGNLGVDIYAKGGVITGSYYYEFRIQLPTGFVAPSADPQIDGWGAVTQEFSFESTFDSANANGPSITLQNTVTITDA